MEYVIYNDDVIYYVIAKRGTKNLYARMIENNIVKISVPYFISKKNIEKFVVDSYYKLLKKKSKNKKSIVNNDKVLVMGEEYNINEIDNIEYLLLNKLKQYLREEYIDICNCMGVKIVPKVILKRVKGYLGQYNKRKHQITLNILIGHLDKECIKYILIHELAHISYMNHGREFWKHIETYLPNYKYLRGKCKKEFVYYENY